MRVNDKVQGVRKLFFIVEIYKNFYENALELLKNPLSEISFLRNPHRLVTLDKVYKRVQKCNNGTLHIYGCLYFSITVAPFITEEIYLHRTHTKLQSLLHHNKLLHKRRTCNANV